MNECLHLKVRTLLDAKKKDWTSPRQNLQWGVKGIVIDISNAHGLCYRVQHSDGTCAWYDPEELETI